MVEEEEAENDDHEYDDDGYDDGYDNDGDVQELAAITESKEREDTEMEQELAEVCPSLITNYHHNDSINHDDEHEKNWMSR